APAKPAATSPTAPSATTRPSPSRKSKQSTADADSLLPDRGNAADAHGAPTDIAVQLLSENGVEDADLSPGQVDGALAVRGEHIVPAGPDKGVDVASHRVEYIVSVPDDPDRWFVAAFSTVGGGDPRDELAEALVEWFDAVMATLRWSHG
ncbi:hypothetical protein RMT89_39110, partial [Streptomyces sp. P17]|nr:hypothetical protein [Streptomyces sp. P17]